MKTKLLVFAICSFFMINMYGQTFQKSINTNNQEHYHDLTIKPANNFDADYFVSGNLFDASMNSYIPTLKKVDVNGNIIWIKKYTSSLPNARIFDIAPFHVVGINAMVAFTGSIDVGGVKKMFIAKVDAATGNFLDARHYDIVSPNFNATGLHISYVKNDANGNGWLEEGFVIGGFFSNDYNINTNVINKGFVMRVYTTLGVFWTIELDSYSNSVDFDAVNHITETNDGYFLTGSANDPATNQLGVLAHKIDFQGNFLWDSSYVFGNSQDVSVDAYYDDISDKIYMLSNYSVSHYFGVTVFDNSTGTFNAAQSWYASGSTADRYGFTILEDINSPNNLIITGYDRDESWATSAGGSFFGQSNLFVHRFEKTTGYQVGSSYQYLVQHTEPPGDEYNFWNGQMPFIYYPNISFSYLDSNYFHVGYKTDPIINFTEADLFKTMNDRINDCDLLEIEMYPTLISKTDITVFSGFTPHNDTVFSINDNPISYLESDCSPTLSIENNEMKEGYIYPNPASSKVNIYVVTDSYYVIYDLNGRQVVSENQLLVGENIIDVQNLMSGIYFVKITSNGNSITKKLIKK